MNLSRNQAAEQKTNPSDVVFTCSLFFNFHKLCIADFLTLFFKVVVYDFALYCMLYAILRSSGCRAEIIHTRVKEDEGCSLGPPPGSSDSSSYSSILEKIHLCEEIYDLE